jgi:hypothetical protein
VRREGAARAAAVAAAARWQALAGTVLRGGLVLLASGLLLLLSGLAQLEGMP